MSSVTTQAILIHNHHGHDLHGHALAIQDLEEWRGNSEYQHEEHVHNERPADPTEDKNESIVIVLNLPVALPRAQGLASCVAVSNPAPTTTVLVIDTATSGNHVYIGSRTSPARLARARSLVADILLTSHALLL